MILYQSAFGGLTPGDIAGQDSYATASGHTGGSVDIIAAGGIGGGQSAAIQGAVGSITWYQRYWDTGLIPNDRIKSGTWYKVDFAFKISSGMTSGLPSIGMAEGETKLPWYLEFDGSTGDVKLTDKSSTTVIGTVTLDADHTIQVTSDEDLNLTIEIDAVPVVGTFQANPYNAEALDVYYGGAMTIADGLVFDSVVVTVRDEDNVYKIYVGK